MSDRNTYAGITELVFARISSFPRTGGGETMCLPDPEIGRSGSR